MSDAEQDRAACPNRYELLTGVGPAAIAVIRLTGPGSAAFLARHCRGVRGRPERPPAAGSTRRATLQQETGARLDDILVSWHGDPPETDIRLHTHGSPAVVRQLRDLLHAAGFVEAPADAAAVWSAPDPIRAAGWQLLPQTVTAEGAAWVLQQVDQLRAAVETLLASPFEADGCAACRRLAQGFELVRWFTVPARIAIVGPPNAGKSTLCNVLADQACSIVSATPGTTRDWLEIPGQISGQPVTWLDTAGLRETADELEAQGIALTQRLVATADAVVWLLDAAADPTATQQFLHVHRSLRATVVAWNKVDLRPPPALDLPWRGPVVQVVAAQRRGLSELGAAVLAGLDRDLDRLRAPAALSPAQADRCRQAADAARETDYRAALEAVLRPVRDASRGIPLASDSSSSI